MCRLKKHAYAELPPSEKHASQGKNMRTNTGNSAFPRALFTHLKYFRFQKDGGQTITNYCSEISKREGTNLIISP